MRSSWYPRQLTTHFSANRGGFTRWKKETETRDLHSDTCDHIGPIPKADITSIRSSRGRIPRHDDQVQLHQDVEHDYEVPGFELRAGKVEPRPSVPDDIQADTHDQLEEGRRQDLEIGNEVEGITSGRRQNHEDSQRPFDEVRSKRSAKGAGGGPKAWEGEHALPVITEANVSAITMSMTNKQIPRDSPSTLPNQPRRPNQHGNQIPKRAQGNQEIQPPHRTTRPKHLGKEQARRNLLALHQLILRHGGKVRHIRQDVQHGHDEQRDKPVPSDLLHWALHFVDHVKGIFKPGVRKDDLVQRVGDAVGRCLTGKGVAEVDAGVGDPSGGDMPA